MTTLLRRILGRPDPVDENAARLAESVMSAARRPSFYSAGLVTDTLEGRFSMVAMHGALLIRHLRRAGDEGFRTAERMGEILFDRFDYALREEGVGDHSIARRMRKLGEEFYGLARALDEALESGHDRAVEAALARNGLGGNDPDRLASHLRKTDESLARQGSGGFAGIQPDWPELAH
ncbi:MAG: ubiquinol-cytochrome C chaperone [Alphaproteobacteria bacterium]|nr:ubiquinol-cytochrome C chaperone [Alphaproteobacteria bacterium]